MKGTIGLRLLVLSAVALLASPGWSEAAGRRTARPKAAPSQPSGSAPAEAKAPLAAPPAAAAAPDVTDIQLGFDLPAGHPGERVTLTARLRDASGRARDAALRLEPDAGSVAEPVRVAPGVYTARLMLPTTLGGRHSLLVVAFAGQAVSSAALPLAPGPAAALSVEAPSELPADGANHPLWVGVTDAHGNPVDEPPRLTVARGQVGELVPIASGEWMVDYRPPRTPRGGTETVNVSAGSAARSQVLALQPVPALVTVAPKAGVVLGMGGGAGLALAADAGAWLGGVQPNLGLVLGVAWWSASGSSGATAPVGLLDLRNQRAWLPVTISAAMRQPLGARGSVTLSLGGGGALVWSKARLTGQPEISESGWAPVAMAGVEVAYRTRFVSPFAEVRGGWVGAPHLDTLRGNAWPVMFLLGSHFDAY